MLDDIDPLHGNYNKNIIRITLRKIVLIFLNATSHPGI